MATDRTALRFFLPLFLVLISCGVASPEDWLQWRGPHGNNTTDPGIKFSDDWKVGENVLWQAPIPGRGHSSPVVAGQTIFVTTADEPNQRQAVIAIDRGTGKTKWITTISEGGFPRIHNNNSHASSTACCDGNKIYAAFHHHDQLELVALDSGGEIVWRVSAGKFRPKAYEYGYGASPTLHRGKVILSGECDTGAWVKAFNTEDGSLSWQADRPNNLNWSSPIVATVAGREQLLLSGCHLMTSLDPNNGKKLWETRCLTDTTCGTVVWDDDTAYASGGYPKRSTCAVVADGSGKIRWQKPVKCYEQSMLIHKGFLYAIDDNGVAYCWEAKSGREMWKSRLRGPVSASPILIGDKIFASSERGVFSVFKTNPNKFELVSNFQYGTDSFASPVVVDNTMYIRVGDRSGGSFQESLVAVRIK